MKRTLFATLSCILLSILLLTACGETNTDSSDSPSSANTPTAVIHADGIPQQPHSEASFEDMVTFLNTVNADAFENGEFKDIIERVRNEGYLIRPYFDGEPALPRENWEQIMLSPVYDYLKNPPCFTYFCSSDEYLYTIDFFYLDEALIPIAKESGFSGIYQVLYGNTQIDPSIAPVHTTCEVPIDGTDTFVTVVTAQTQESSYAEFMWDEKYLVKIHGNYIENKNALKVINLDILPHLSFEKMPLNPTASTTPTESSAPQPSESLPDEGNSTGAPILPTQAPGESSTPQPSQSLPDEGNSTEAPISPTQAPAE